MLSGGGKFGGGCEYLHVKGGSGWVEDGTSVGVDLGLALFKSQGASYTKACHAWNPWARNIHTHWRMKRKHRSFNVSLQQKGRLKKIAKDEFYVVQFTEMFDCIFPWGRITQVLFTCSAHHYVYAIFCEITMLIATGQTNSNSLHCIWGQHVQFHPFLLDFSRFAPWRNTEDTSWPSSFWFLFAATVEDWLS